MPTSRRSEWVLLLQATLVALPVAGIACAAVYFLRIDRTQVEAQARESAQVLAPELVRQLSWRAGGELSHRVNLQKRGKIADGRIVSVGGFADFPVPDNWPRKLSAEQARWWKTGQSAIYRQGDVAAGTAALRALAKSAAA